MPLTNKQTRDIQSILHPYTNPKVLKETGALVYESGKGVFVYDEKGKDYIEAMSGLWCNALGWGEEALVEAAAEQMRRLAHGHLFAGKSHEPAIALAEKLKEIAPFRVGKVFFANSGSEANDTQVKLFWYANNARGLTKKKTIISRMKAYHGVTMVAASLSGLPANHKSFDLPLFFVRHTDCPHYFRNAQAGESEEQFSTRMAANLEALINEEGSGTIAAMIVEPVYGAGGAFVPPKGYFTAIQEVLRKHGIALINDEVITGFGRTGNWWGAETYGIKPDTMSVAKALSSAYLPIAAVLISPELADLIDSESGKIGTFGHGYTYSGHPVSCAVALKTIEIYESRKILDHVRKVSPRFLQRLYRLAENPVVTDVQGVGLIGGFELVPAKTGKPSFDAAKGVAIKFGMFCQEEGVIVRSVLGERIAVCPPLIIGESEIDEMFDRIERGLSRGLQWAKDEGLVE
ncbi:MAG: aminotransferase [Alphaproteobacteria bacterium]